MRLAGRSPRELAFRLNQQIINLAIWAFSPRMPAGTAPVDLPLPIGKNVANLLLDTPYAADILLLGDAILAHRFPILDATVALGREIEWRRDYVNNKVSGTAYFRFVPYLNFDVVGDHKNIWELNRHQHLVVLAQAYLLDSNPAYLKEIGSQLDSWWVQNAFLKGINWASALEVAFRALSWLWVDHLLGESMGKTLQQRLWNSLYQHAAFLECNLSTYFSPNTHLLGEAVALHAIGLRLGITKWKVLGEEIVREQLDRQVQPDGSHFEQSTYYHVYALDFFVLHYILAGRPSEYVDKLRKMARFLAAVVGPARLLTCFGDDDGGRLFHPYGPRDQFARATLATCSAVLADGSLPFEPSDLPVQASWWLGVSELQECTHSTETTLFPESGLLAIVRGDLHILIDTGPLGAGGAGHSHADCLSLTVRVGERELLIDPGTYTYVADAGLRNEFRGTAFHNTIRVDGLNQAEPAGPFRWNEKPAVRRITWSDHGEMAFLDAECSYRSHTHRRRILLIDDELLFVTDEVTSTGPMTKRRIEQFWHLADSEVSMIFSDPGAVQNVEGLRSRVLGQKETVPVLLAAWEAHLPHICSAALFLRGAPSNVILKQNRLEVSIPGVISVSFPDEGMPRISKP